MDMSEDMRHGVGLSYEPRKVIGSVFCNFYNVHTHAHPYTCNPTFSINRNMSDKFNRSLIDLLFFFFLHNSCFVECRMCSVCIYTEVVFFLLVGFLI